MLAVRAQRPSNPLGKPQSHGALTATPLPSAHAGGARVDHPGRSRDRVRITEVGEEGSVPDLRVPTWGTCPCCSWTASSWWAPSRTASLI
jgi:hypothetical protein